MHVRGSSACKFLVQGAKDGGVISVLLGVVLGIGRDGERWEVAGWHGFVKGVGGFVFFH